MRGHRCDSRTRRYVRSGQSTARRCGKRQGLLLIVLSLLLVLLGSVGVLGVGDLVLVDRMLNLSGSGKWAAPATRSRGCDGMGRCDWSSRQTVVRPPSVWTREPDDHSPVRAPSGGAERPEVSVSGQHIAPTSA